jgi:hypothetical protein
MAAAVTEDARLFMPMAEWWTWRRSLRHIPELKRPRKPRKAEQSSKARLISKAPESVVAAEREKAAKWRAY